MSPNPQPDTNMSSQPYPNPAQTTTCVVDTMHTTCGMPTDVKQRRGVTDVQHTGIQCAISRRTGTDGVQQVGLAKAKLMSRVLTEHTACHPSLKEPYFGLDVLPAKRAHRHFVAALVAGLVAATKGQAALVLHAHSTAQRLSTCLSLVLRYAALQDHLAHSLGAGFKHACSSNNNSIVEKISMNGVRQT